MSDQLEVQLSTLRAARDQLLASTLHIGDSVAALRAILRELAALGYEGIAGAPPLPHALTARCDHDLDTLNHLKNQLDQTVYAVENAAVAHFPPLGALLNPSPLTLALRSERAAPVLAPVATTFTPDRYVSRTNQGLYQAFASRRDELASQQARLLSLTTTRADLDADLRALRNRISAEPGTVSVNTAEAARLETHIRQLDADITRTHGDIGRLQGDVDTLGARLERVAPGAGANLAEIRQLEVGQSADAVQQNTEGCVNYIVQRVHIPALLARDAHLWNDIAAEHPQLGITQSHTPLPGSVLVMEREHSYADDLYGHVMYVERVDGATVWVTDNLHPTPVPLSDLTTETSGANLTYLYLPWHTAG